MSKGKRATPENALAQDAILRTRHLVAWMRNNVGVADYGSTTVRYGCGGVGGSDYIGIVRRTGQFIACEFKVHPRKATEQQLRFLRMVKRNGGLAVLAYCAEDLFAALDMALYGRVLPRGRLRAA